MVPDAASTQVKHLVARNTDELVKIIEEGSHKQKNQ